MVKKLPPRGRRVRDALVMLVTVPCFCVFLVLFLHSREGLLLSRVQHVYQDGASTTASDSPRFATLIFGNRTDTPMVEHNCMLLKDNGVRFTIHTDDVHQAVCQSCKCEPFVPVGCRCPQPERSNCWVCEKLNFMIRLIESTDEFVFMDSDLIILKEEFLPALLARTRHFDFLAAYGHGNKQKWQHTSPFNSGFMFMRRLPDLNYSLLLDIMDSKTSNSDQSVMSIFVHEHYRRWDSLSLRWHCRYLFKEEHNINFTDCFTLHARYPILQKYIGESNFKLRKLPVVR